MRCATANATPAGTNPWLAFAEIAAAVPALSVLLDAVRGYVMLNTPPEQVWWGGGGPLGARASIRQVLADATRAGVALPPDAELIVIDRFLAELFSRPVALLRWGGTVN